MSEYTEETDREIKSVEFLERNRKKPEYFTRERKMPFEKLCLFLLNIVKESLQEAGRRFLERTGSAMEISEQSLSEARQKIKWEAFRKLFEVTVKVAYSGYYEKWNGYRVWAVDGTKLALPNCPSVGKIFGELKGSPTAQASILYDVLNYTVADAIIDPISTDERSMCRQHLEQLCERVNPEKELIILDRGYASGELINDFKSKNISFLMRVKRGFSKAVDEFDGSDGFIKIGEHKVRVIKIMLETGEKETLITDLLEDFDFEYLYFKRWGVEKEFDVLKNTLEIENFSGRTETAIRQDFFIHMWYANILAAGFWEAQEKVEKERNNGQNKYRYEVNISHAAGVLHDYLILAVLAENDGERKKIFNKITELISKAVRPVRPKRIVERIPNTRRSKFHHNRKSNL